MSIFFIIELQLPAADGFVSGADNHGLVLILQRCRGDGAIFVEQMLQKHVENTAKD